MSLFSFSGKGRDFFVPEDEELIVQAIRSAEKRTSGEIRVFVESRCRFVDPVDRAAEVFFTLKMENTEDRNGVLIYIAMKDRQLAIYGDEGIHQAVGSRFWAEEVAKLLAEFNAQHFVDGIVQIIHDIGTVLTEKFPYEREDRNELPDNIVFGQ